ncbi:MAG: hypothetical protein ACE5J1_00165 [Nitrospiria bacterium]
MEPKSRFLRKMLTGVVTLLLIACAGQRLRDGEPEWVRVGSGPLLDKEQKVFYGVGAIEGIINRQEPRTTADNEARLEISKTFAIYLAILMGDYMVSTRQGDLDQRHRDQDIERIIKAFSEITLSSIVIVDRWTDQSDGISYTLARLDLDHFKRNIQQMEDLDPPVREFVRENVDKGFVTLERAKR